jgi:CBS-domain-containing membrane protein
MADETPHNDIEMGSPQPNDQGHKDEKKKKHNWWRRTYFPPRSKFDYGFETPKSFLHKAFNHSLADTIGDRPPTFFNAFWSLLASFVGILVISVISTFATADNNFNILFAFAGASAVLLYAIPGMPAAQPRHMIFGHVISSVVSVTVRVIFGGDSLIWLQAPISVSFSIFFMQLTGTINPPGGAVALFYTTASTQVRDNYYLYVAQSLVCVLILMVVAVIFDNLPKFQKYPKYWL